MLSRQRTLHSRNRSELGGAVRRLNMMRRWLLTICRQLCLARSAWHGTAIDIVHVFGKHTQQRLRHGSLVCTWVPDSRVVSN